MLGWEIVLAAVGGIIVPLVIAWTSKLQTRISNTEKDLSKFMVESARTYVTKDDLNSFESKITERLDRLEDKIDSLLKK